MTDELMIQPQVQPRKQANPLVYGTVGALAGAGAGALVNQTEFIKGKKIGSVQDIINDANSKDKAEFSTKYASTPEEARTKLMAEAAEVKRLKDEIKNLPSKTLPADAEEAKALEEAKKARNAEFEKLLEAEKARIGSGSTYTAGSKFPSKKTLEDSLTKSEYKIAEPYLNDYERARRNLVGRPGSGFVGGTASGSYKELKDAKTNVANVYDDIYAKYSTLSKKKQANFDPKEGFSKNRIKSYINTILPEKGYDSKIKNYKDFLELQEKFGEEIFSLVDEKPTRRNVFDRTPIISVRKDGKKQWVQIDYDAIKDKRVALFDEMAENVNKMNDLTKQRLDFEKKFFKDNKDALKLDLHQPINSVADLKKLQKPGKYTQELKDIDFYKDGLERKTLKYPQTFTTMHGTTIHLYNKDDLKKLEKYRRQTEAGLDLSQQATKEIGSMFKERGSIILQDPVVAGAQKKFNRTIAEDKGIKNVFQRMERELSRRGSDKDKEVYDKIMDLVGKKEIADGDIEARAKEAVESRMKGGSFEAAVEKAQKAYDKAIESKGVANGEAKAALESKLATAESNVTKFAEEMCTKGGKNKLLAPIIGGIALGLAGLGLASSKNS